MSKENLQLWPYLPNSPDEKYRSELKRAFQEATETWPGIKFTYVGHDDTHHYFQEWGNPNPFKVEIQGEQEATA